MSYSPHPSGRSRVAARIPTPPMPAQKTAVRKATAPKKRSPKAQPQKAVRRAAPRKIPTQKAVWAGGSVATLALLVILPGQVGSQSVVPSDCLQVVRSGAEISRDQLLQMIALPVGSSQQAVRQVTDVPYCVLPSGLAAEAGKRSDPVAEADKREAYPLAFDPDTWVVLGYEANEYVGYDFVFKP